MKPKEMVFEVAQRFIEMDNEIRSLRVVLRRYWTHETPAEAFVQKGVQQLQDRERAERGSRYPESAFDAATDEGALIRILHEQTLERAKIPQ
jgi:hypothetical protein